MDLDVTIRVRAAVLLVGFLSISGSALADGLQRFEREVLPKLPPGSIIYDSAASLGVSGFVLNKAVVTDMAQGNRASSPSSIHVDRLTVEQIDFDGLGRGEIPHFAKMRMDGVVEMGNREFEALRKRYGVRETLGDLRLEYRFDPRAQTLVVTRFEANAPGLSRLSLEVALDNVRSLSVVDQKQWTETVALRSLKLNFEDQSALQLGVRAMGEQFGKTEAALVREWQTAIAVMSSGKGAQSSLVADTLVSFLQDYRRPKGVLRITVQPTRPLPLGSLMVSILSVDPALALGLAMTYPGARQGAAAATLNR
ncbi:MAG: hypothetical protein EXQ95_06415 [Alphaproteobacteria bacterium]|nr:hypothetical protein [Alphaproteobacteria bacterium]